MRNVFGLVVLAVVLSGCQSDRSTQVLSPREFLKATGGLTLNASGTNQTATASTDLKPRIITPGMPISVSVAEDSSLNRQFIVGPGGEIDFPALGRVVVEGLTPDEVAQKIREGLERDYFHKATVSVSIETAAGGGVIYVLGSVGRPGPLLLPKDQPFTVVKAIIAVGGCGVFGNCAKVQLIRYGEGGKKYKTTVNVERIMKRGEFERDIPVQNGDWILVPEKLFSF